MKKLFLLVLGAVGLLANWTAPVVAAQLNADMAWNAVGRLWSWQKFWSGSIDAERCFERWVNKRARVTFHQFPLSYSRYMRLPARSCTGCGDEPPKVQTMTVQIADTVHNYVVAAAAPGPEGFQQKAFATIILPDPTGCRDPETRRRERTYRAEGIPTLTQTRQLAAIDPLPLPPVEENLRDDVVLKAVQRSMAYFRPPRPSDPSPPGRPPEPVSPERLAQIRGTRTVLIGRFDRSDPFLLLWYQGDDTVYTVIFPAPDVLADVRMCLVLIGAPSGQFADTMRERRLKEKLTKNSIVVEVPASTP
jgi:hypothetical protein